MIRLHNNWISCMIWYTNNKYSMYVRVTQIIIISVWFDYMIIGLHVWFDYMIIGLHVWFDTRIIIISVWFDYTNNNYFSMIWLHDNWISCMIWYTNNKYFSMIWLHK
jgi:hypothetical protein